jgi:SAM-dependent methyltransferase
MDSTFDLYAAYYDLLYRDKDYSNEVNYISSSILASGGVSEGSILELGCGTGGHAVHLASSNRMVHGIDLSAEMVQRANASKSTLPTHLNEKLTFEVGDIRSFRSTQKFDAVVSLFHVISYQTKNEDIINSFNTARYHLQPGGLFFFDFWYGPSVLSDRPKVVEKVVEDEFIQVLRHTTPTMLIDQNCVDICFDVDICLKQHGAVKQRLTEHHLMRYLFLPEIEYYLSLCGLAVVSAQTWLQHAPLTDRSWYGCIVARAI